MNPRQKRIIIIGAGPGGLACAMLLASRGFDVRVFEKKPATGGRSGTMRLGPYRFDAGSTILMMPYLLRELFAQCGQNVDELLTLIRLDPLYHLDFGTRKFDLPFHKARLAEVLRSEFPGNQEGYRRFLEIEKKRFEACYPLLQASWGSMRNFLRGFFFRSLPWIYPAFSLRALIRRYFNDERLITAFTFQSAYLGMPPGECPAFFSMIPYVEHAYGVWYAKGGLGSIWGAMEQVITGCGGKISCQRGVDEILTRGDKVTGVRLADGLVENGDDFVLNADLAASCRTLFAAGTLKKHSPAWFDSRSYSCSAFCLYLGLDRPLPLAHHNLFFAEDIDLNMRDIFKTGRPPADMSIYAANPSVSDAGMAPAGHSAFFLMVPVANLQSGTDWSQGKAAYREAVLGRFRQRTGIDLVPHIREERLLTPADWQDQMNVHLGALFNLAHKPLQLLNFRPHNAFEDFTNLYLASGGTHPGSGLPTILESARISANLILEKYGLEEFAQALPPPPDEP